MIEIAKLGPANPDVRITFTSEKNIKGVNSRMMKTKLMGKIK